jgi:hypothetical protein
MTDMEMKRKRLKLKQLQGRASQQDRGENVRQANALRYQQATGKAPPEPNVDEPNRIAERDMARAQISRNEAFSRGLNSGQLLGFDDEASGVLDGNQQMTRGRLDLARTAYPGLTGTAEFAGMMTSPASIAAPVTRTIKGAAAVGGGLSAVDAAGRAEGSAIDRADEFAKGAATGVFFSGLSSALLKGANKGLQALARRAEKRPTIETLKAVKDRSYAAVRKANISFDQNEMLGALNRLNRLAKTSRYDLDSVSEVDKAAFDALRVMQRRAELGRPISLNNLDKTRQKLWDVYGKSDHPFVLKAIGEIDGLIAGKAQGNEIMTAAREANSRYAKAQLLQNAFKKAERQTAATGSGGNILNKYRQAVVRILETPRESKWFSADEIAIMDDFVMGDNAENALRRVGKLAPGGNGLMTALNFYAATVDPAMLVASGAASAAKAAADNSAMKGSQGILDAVSTGVIQAPKPGVNLTPAAVGAAAAQSRF